MITQSKLLVRQASHSDQQKLANLIHFETYVHRHLDWRNPLDFIEQHPYLVLEKGNELCAALACPPDPPRISWIRLFACTSMISINEAWQALWSQTLETLSRDEVCKVAVIPLHEWLYPLLTQSGFTTNDRVITLLWKRQVLPASKENINVIIRPMTLDDIENVALLDNLAFNALWRNSRSSLEIAFRQATIATVVDCKGLLVGYQISTANQMGGHLARLAIHPEYQGKGLGYALLRDMLIQIERRGTGQVTVNTQEENSISLSLYVKAGFTYTGEKYQVYELDLPSLK
jgi:ribosomal protein S18 acetylase RimI-like enzyme